MEVRADGMHETQCGSLCGAVFVAFSSPEDGWMGGWRQSQSGMPKKVTKAQHCTSHGYTVRIIEMFQLFSTDFSLTHKEPALTALSLYFVI